MRYALFFDLDGTLWNAVNEITESYNLAMKKNNLNYFFDVAKVSSYMGLTPLETVKLAFNDVDTHKGMEYFKILLNEEIKYLSIHPGKMYPFEKEVIISLAKKYDLYIVSNADKGYIENYLNGHNMNQYFKGHLCAGDTNLDKSENITYLKNKENIDKVIYIGDTYKDMVESKKANVPFIFASYGFGKIDNPQYKISSLKELESLVDNIFFN